MCDSDSAFFFPSDLLGMLTLGIIQKFFRSLTRTFTNAENLVHNSLNSLIWWQVGEIKLTRLQDMLKLKARSELGPVFWAQQT